MGAESTGTTTLARTLAAHYQTAWVPEYGRTYAEGRPANPGQPWRSEEFTHIARAQNALEDRLAETCDGLLICDTDAFATGVWHERYLGTRSADVERLARQSNHDLYIVTGDEIPFVQDGTRDGERIRHWMHGRFLERLEEDSKPFIVVRGTPEARLKAAVQAIDELGANNSMPMTNRDKP